MKLNIDSPPTIVWRNDRIEIIDQTLLPAELKVIKLDTVDQVVDAISRLAVRGAPAIGAAGAYGVVVALDEGKPASLEEAMGILDSDGDRISNARPTAVNLSWAVERVCVGARRGQSVEEVRSIAMEIADAVSDEDRAACDSIGKYGAAELADYTTIMTHCNAGRLATVGIGTALGVIYGKAREGQDVEVYSSETRPLLQGARLTSWELSQAGIPVTVMPDSAGSSLLRTGRIEAVVVGADRIAANGDTANKIGTYTHALAAKAAGVPFYVVAPTSTLDIVTATGDEIEIEQRTPDEIHWFGDRQTTPVDMNVWNPAFDVTNAELITAIITEAGVLRPPYVDSIREALDKVAQD